jgi:hypothetical protein
MSALLPNQNRKKQDPTPIPMQVRESSPVDGDPALEVSAISLQGSALRNVPVWRFVAAFVVAALADVLLPSTSVLVAPLLIGDLGVALVLCFILGFNWLIIPTLLIEAIPGLCLFPTWTLVVLSIAGINVAKRR